MIALSLALPALAQAEIFKCVDGTGHTTYQQSPCPASARGGRVELNIDNGNTRGSAEDEAVWEAAARERNVLVGMPPRYVRLARGTPREARPARADENASEVWSYAEPDARMLRLGFRNGGVTWMRYDSVDGDASPQADDEATQRVLRRRTIGEGSNCAELAPSLGPPDQTTNPPAPLGTPPDSVVRYVWEPAPGDPYVRTTVTCVAGRVTKVERANAR
jgi:hypothetical protein